MVQNGVLTNDSGERMSLTFVLRSVEERRMVTVFVDQLQKLGVATRLRLVDAAHYVNIMKDFDFDFSFGQLGVANPAGVEIVSYWHSSNAMLPRTRNLSGIASTAVDEMIMRVLNGSLAAGPDGGAKGPRPDSPVELPDHPADRGGGSQGGLLEQIRPASGGRRVPHQFPVGLVVRRDEGSPDSGTRLSSTRHPAGS